MICYTCEESYGNNSKRSPNKRDPGSRKRLPSPIYLSSDESIAHPRRTAPSKRDPAGTTSPSTFDENRSNIGGDLYSDYGDDDDFFIAVTKFQEPENIAITPHLRTILYFCT